MVAVGQKQDREDMLIRGHYSMGFRMPVVAGREATRCAEVKSYEGKEQKYRNLSLQTLAETLQWRTPRAREMFKVACTARM